MVHKVNMSFLDKENKSPVSKKNTVSVRSCYFSEDWSYADKRTQEAYVSVYIENFLETYLTNHTFEFGSLGSRNLVTLCELLYMPIQIALSSVLAHWYEPKHLIKRSL